MKALRELFESNPILLLLLLAIGIIFPLILFHLTTNKKNSLILEKFFIGFILICWLKISRPPFGYIKPDLLAEDKTPNLAYIQIGIYAVIIFILLSRIRYFIKDFVFVTSAIITQNPFFCAVHFLCVFSVFWSETPALTLRASLVMIACMTLAVYISYQYSWKEICSLLCWTYTIVGIAGLGERANQLGDWTGLLLSKNAMAGLMAFTAVLWYLKAVDESKGRWFSIGMTFWSFFLMKRANSGGALVVSWLLIALSSYLRYAKTLSLTWAFASISFFIFASSAISIFITDNLELIVVGWLNKDITFTGRTVIWELILKEASKRPWLGYGYMGFFQRWRGMEDPAYSVITPNEWVPGNAHNGYIQILVTLGWVGLILLLLSILKSLYLAVQYLVRSPVKESVVPTLLITYAIVKNISEAEILDFTYVNFFYVLATVKLCLDSAGNNFSGKTSSQDSAYP